MVRINTFLKAKKLISEEGIFKITDTPNYEYWIVKGVKKDLYEIIFNKNTEIYTCICKNVRLIDCSHIIAIRIIKGEEEDVQANYMELVV